MVSNNTTKPYEVSTVQQVITVVMLARANKRVQSERLGRISAQGDLEYEMRSAKALVST